MRKQAGFTLVEIMIVVIIVSILAAIAYPSYQSSVRKARRAEAHAALLDLAARQERFLSEHSSYSNAVGTAGTCGELAASIWTENRYYRLQLVRPVALRPSTVVPVWDSGGGTCVATTRLTNYAVLARAVGAARNFDPDCLSIALDASGKKWGGTAGGYPGLVEGECW